MRIPTKRTLYVLKFKNYEQNPHRPLTAEEKLAGWRESKSWLGEPLVDNEGHQKGALRERRASHVLSWEVAPGEEVVVALTVNFVETWFGDPNSPGKVIDAAVCHPVAHGLDGRFLIVLKTVLGRAVSLGEDGAEDAFGNDAIKDHLEAVVNGDDWRKTLCDCTLVEEPDDDKAYNAWVERKNKSTVRVTRLP